MGRVFGCLHVPTNPYISKVISIYIYIYKIYRQLGLEHRHRRNKYVEILGQVQRKATWLGRVVYFYLKYNFFLLVGIFFYFWLLTAAQNFSIFALQRCYFCCHYRSSSDVFFFFGSCCYCLSLFFKGGLCLCSGWTTNISHSLSQPFFLFYFFLM